VLLAAACAVSAGAQQPDVPKFEAVVVHLTPATTTNWRNEFVPGRMRFENRTLRDMIKFAYGLASDSQVVGATGWMLSEHFDVSAREDEALAQRLQTAPREEWVRVTRELVRDVLEERFNLRVEPKKMELPVFALVLAKGGAKVKPTNPSDGRTFYGIVGPAGHMDARSTTMAMLADRLTGFPEANGRLVVDRTRLAEKFDWKLQWSPEAMGAGTADAEGGPSLFTALQEQLGLRLASQKGDVDAVVIVRAERPTEN